MSDCPALKVTLKPCHDGKQVSHVDIAYELDGVELEQGDLLAQIHLEAASIPVCEFSEEGLVAVDEEGVIPLNVTVEFDTFADARKWRTGRKTRGTIRWKYRVFPRVVPENYTSSPYFDLRNEQGGINGAGVPFMVQLNDQKTEYRISLQWDLTSMPAGSRGVWCMGEGDVTLQARSELLEYSYYAAGAVKTWRAPGNTRLEFHYLSDPNFDVEAVAGRIYALFKYYSTFFEDEQAPLQIFARKDPFKKSGGGTALKNSFMFGYSDEVIPTPDGMLDLLAHEMVHNWPHLDEPQASSTWYAEGTAEYYSLVLPYRAGLTTLDQLVTQIQRRADHYYGNPFRNMSNEEAVDMYWKDRRTQRIPYGRGFFYLVSVNHKIRKASGGKRSVDDVVLELLRMERKTGTQPKCADWVRLVSVELGRDVQAEFDAMCKGDLILPSDEWFGGVFRARSAVVPQYVNKWEESRETIDGFVWERNPDVPEEAAVV